jgi:hypothetical protein
MATFRPRAVRFGVGAALFVLMLGLVGVAHRQEHRAAHATVPAEMRQNAGPIASVAQPSRLPLAPTSVWETAGSWVVLHDSEGQALALVSVPSAPETPHAVAIAVHGSISSAEWHCPRARDAVGSDRWLICPHPSRHLGEHAKWLNAASLAHMIDAALTALIARVGVRVDSTHLYLLGEKESDSLARSSIAMLPHHHFEVLTFVEAARHNAPSGAHGIPSAIASTGSPDNGANLPLLDAAPEDAVYNNGHRLALVNVPAGVGAPRPWVFAFHAAGVGPHYACYAARIIFGDVPIIVCPDDAPTPRSLSDVLAAGWRFRRYLNPNNVSYFGYSQGALQSAAVLATSNSRAGLTFHTLVLLEGPPTEPRFAQLVGAAGIARTLLVSGQGGWAWQHDALAQQLVHNGVNAVHLKLAFGHVPNDDVLYAARDALARLVSAQPL